MKTAIIKLQVILIVLAFCVAGCKKEDPTGVKFSELDKAPKALVSKEELPKFVIDKMFSPSTIYKGKWNESIVYFVMNYLSSSVCCDVYFEKGEKIIFNESIMVDFQSTSKNWVIIYEDLKKGHR